jgi:hypothetical protein
MTFAPLQNWLWINPLMEFLTLSYLVLMAALLFRLEQLRSAHGEPPSNRDPLVTLSPLALLRHLFSNRHLLLNDRTTSALIYICRALLVIDLVLFMASLAHARPN